MKSCDSERLTAAEMSRLDLMWGMVGFADDRDNLLTLYSSPQKFRTGQQWKSRADSHDAFQNTYI